MEDIVCFWILLKQAYWGTRYCKPSGLIFFSDCSLQPGQCCDMQGLMWETPGLFLSLDSPPGLHWVKEEDAIRQYLSPSLPTYTAFMGKLISQKTRFYLSLQYQFRTADNLIKKLVWHGINEEVIETWVTYRSKMELLLEMYKNICPFWWVC